MKRSHLCILLALTMLFSLAACGESGSTPGGETAAPAADETPALSGAEIQLNGDSASSRASGIAISGSTVTIAAPGEYVLRGTLSDGRIIVNTAGKAGDVVLTLDGVDITCLTDSAIYVAQADEVDLELAPGSHNVITSGTEADIEKHNDQSSGAAIYAEDDLDIKGEGALEIYGYINNGVTCKDDLCVKGGTVSVQATNNGLRGSESVRISGGTLTVTAGKDGIKSTSAVKEGKGFVEISEGSVSVVSVGDAISAETELTVSGGVVKVSTSGGESVTSSKGLKAKTALTVSGGEIHVESFDHCLRSAAELTVSGGSITAVSADGKGLSAEGALLIGGGEVTVTAMTDGVFSESAVTVQDGVVTVSAGADGLKAGSKGTGFETPVGAVAILGGDVRVTAAEDPIDAKASLQVSGGTVLAIGSSKRLKSFDEDSTQRFLAWTFSGATQNTVTVSAGGEELASIVAAYGYNSVLFSAPELSAGTEYTVANGINSARQTLN